jgi:hypothetical protein
VQTGAHGQSTLRRTAAVNPAPPRPGPQRSEEFRISAPPSTHPVDAELAAPSPRSSSADSSSGEAFGRTAEGAAPPLAAPSGVVVGPRELARNPFVVALAVLAAVLILSVERATRSSSGPRKPCHSARHSRSSPALRSSPCCSCSSAAAGAGANSPSVATRGTRAATRTSTRTSRGRGLAPSCPPDVRGRGRWCARRRRPVR